MNGTRNAVYKISSAQKLLYRPIAWNIFTSGMRATVGASISPARMTISSVRLNGMLTFVNP